MTNLNAEQNSFSAYKNETKRLDSISDAPDTVLPGIANIESQHLQIELPVQLLKQLRAEQI